jgi:copper chaperone CopZ
MNTSTYTVTGMTCGHCVGAVTQEVSGLPGVTDVTIDLVPEGLSTVTVSSAGPLAEDAVRAAVDEAGYELAGAALGS